MEIFSTREKIMDAAIKLFSDRGYKEVSMRDLAKMVGIKASSIYNHFPSKHRILQSLYDFYVQTQQAAAPALDDLLRMAETEPVAKIMAKLDYHYPPSTQEWMDRILIIGIQGIYIDEDSNRFVRKNMFDYPMELLVPLLNRLVELDKIDPVDVTGFVHIMVYYSFSTAFLNLSTMKISLDHWQKGMGMIFSLLAGKQGKK
jgi:AcrR family transcriptional regulator